MMGDSHFTVLNQQKLRTRDLVLPPVMMNNGVNIVSTHTHKKPTYIGKCNMILSWNSQRDVKFSLMVRTKSSSPPTSRSTASSVSQFHGDHPAISSELSNLSHLVFICSQINNPVGFRGVAEQKIAKSAVSHPDLCDDVNPAAMQHWKRQELV